MKNLSIIRLILILLALITILSCSEDSDRFNQDPVSDNQHMKSGSNISEYLPGTDITEQLRADLNAGLDVNLPAGHFYVSETIIVEGYSGTVKGAGKDVTIIEAAQGYKATEDPMFPWPNIKLTEMFAIEWAKGDVTIKDMTILVTGDSPAEAHLNPFHGWTTTIDNVIVVAGVHAEALSGITVTLHNLEIRGEDSDDSGSLNGKNLAYPVVIGGVGGTKPVSACIKNCEIKNSGLIAIEYFDVFGGAGIIKDNEIMNCRGGIWTGFMTDPLTQLGELNVKDNIFTDMTWYAIRNMNTWSSYCLKNNTLDGELMADDCSE